jgi:hypothetical protein
MKKVFPHPSGIFSKKELEASERALTVEQEKVRGV